MKKLSKFDRAALKFEFKLKIGEREKRRNTRDK
jgi:hypothetical protein